jgi:hypothetical protein
MSLLNLVSNRACYNTDKYDLGYIHEFYNRLFNPIKDSVTNILEIGIHAGDSMMLWRDFFTNATVYGIDVNFCARVHNQNRIVDIYKNAYDISVSSQFSKNQFDIIIDDGPHTLETMSFFLTNYLPCLKSGGILIVEDIIDCNWTPELLQLLDPNAGKITRVDMRGKQKTQWHLDKWASGLDVIVFEKF